MVTRTNPSQTCWTRVQLGVARLKQVPAQITLGLQGLTRMPAVSAMKAKAAAHDLNTQWGAVLRSPRLAPRIRPQSIRRPSTAAQVPPPVRLTPRPRVEGVELANSRPMTARDRQVQADRAFFATHRQELSSGQYWAGRGQDGSLQMVSHSWAAADMFQGIDRSVRVQQGRDSVEFLQGEAEGSAQGVQGLLSGIRSLCRAGVSLVTHPVETLQQTAVALHKSGAGRAAVGFSRSSEELVRQGLHLGLQQLDQTMQEPRSGGRLVGRGGTEVVLSVIPPGTAALGVFAFFRRSVKVAEATGESIRGVADTVEALEQVAVGRWPSQGLRVAAESGALSTESALRLADHLPDPWAAYATAPGGVAAATSSGAAALSQRRLTIAIEKACASPDRAVRLEGQAAKAIRSDVTGFQKKVIDPATGRTVGEIDVETPHALIEVTNIRGGKTGQLENYLKPEVNLEGKSVVLYAPRYTKAGENSLEGLYEQGLAFVARTEEQLQRAIEITTAFPRRRP